MTIQQQLAALGPSFEVDGVEWVIKKDTPEFITIFEYALKYTTITVSFYKEGGSAMECVGDFNIKYRMTSFEQTTPADACRQALAMCRERVSELAGALGMGQDSGAAREPIENALYATRRFLTTEASELANGIIQYLNDAGYILYHIQPTGEKEGQV